MTLSIPAKITGGAVHGTLGAPLGVVGTGLNTGKLGVNLIADTCRSIFDVLKDPFTKQTYTTFGKRYVDSWKNYKTDNKNGRKKFRSPYEGKRDQSYGTSKLASWPTHALYGGLKYGLGTALDATWRGVATPFTWAGNMFLKKENRVKLRNGEKGFKANQKKWRGSYKEGFTQLKKKKEREQNKDEKSASEKKDEKKKEEPKGSSANELKLQKENEDMKKKLEEVKRQNEEMKKQIEEMKIVLDNTQKQLKENLNQKDKPIAQKKESQKKESIDKKQENNKESEKKEYAEEKNTQ